MPSKALLTITAFFLAVFISFNLNAQLKVIEGTPVSDFDNSKDLKTQFTGFEVFRFDAANFNRFSRTSGLNVQFQLKAGEHDWTVAMTPNNLKSSNYQLKAANEDGIEVDNSRINKTYKGYLPDGSDVRLTLDNNFIYGFFEDSDDTYYIEPLQFLVEGAPADLFVVYGEKNVKKADHATCGFSEEQRMEREWEGQIKAQKEEAKSSQLACYDVTIQLAADWSMRTKYGSVSGAENFMFGVLNNVANNYDDEFANDMILVSGGTWVSNCSSCDPWNSTTNASTLLGSFRSWGQSNGFGTSAYDVASLWTNRDLDGTTVGIAYVGGTCGSFKYNVCQDFTTNANSLRVLQAHELGHNFDANHDGSGTQWIMAPAVQNTTVWSPTSTNDINSFITFRLNQGGCFSACSGGGGNPPVADFTSNISNPICAGDQVNFTDLSTFNPTSWSWDFGDGTFSSQQNPVHIFNSSGTFDVSLTVTNLDGSDTYTEFNYAVVLDLPSADFSFTTLQNFVQFTDQSIDATSWFWDFDDGDVSNGQNPVHTYNTDGNYLVTLEASNGCGLDFATMDVDIVTAPTAAFTSDVTDGCAPLTVNFTDQSSYNTNSVQWFFPTGTPSSSTAFNPTVTFDTPGPHDVTLIASNSQFDDQLDEIGYITVDASNLMAGFTETINQSTVNFTDQSTGGSTVTWDFGDGNTSATNSPVHTYLNDGTYTVIQTIQNNCDFDTETKVITIVTPPSADFFTNDIEGCAPYFVSFSNNSTSNVNTYEWTFPGGTPATSTDVSPLVTYNNPGNYDVKLKVSNSLFSDSLTITNYISVDTFAVANFTSVTNFATVNFTNTSQNYWHSDWDFGDGNTSTDTNPIHTYATDGTYTVTLEVENDCGIEDIQQQITIVSQPTAAFAGTPTMGCTDLTVNFTNQSTNGTSYIWNFPGGNPATSTNPNPTVVYNLSGNYDVELIVNNSLYSDTLTFTDFVNASSIPTGGFTEVTSLDTAFFTNTSVGQNSVLWEFGDGTTSTDTNPMHVYPGNGTYTVNQITTNGCGNQTTTQQVTISLIPSASFGASATTGCLPFAVNYNNMSSFNATSYNWSFPGGTPAVSTAQNPSVTYNAKGIYDATLIVGNTVGFDTLTFTNYITVEDLPTAAFNETIANFTVANFTNTSADATSYKWYFGTGDSSTMMNPTYDFGTDGTYNVELRSTNNCGVVSTFKTITIVTPPTSDFMTTQMSSGCTPYQVQFTSLASANSTSYQWSFPGGTPATSTDQNPMITYNTIGDYNVELAVSNTAGNDTEMKANFVNVITNPVAAFTSNVNLAEVVFTNNSTGSTSVLWDFGDGNTSTDTNPTYTYGADGNYTVTQSVTNACGTVTMTESISIVTPPTSGFGTSATTIGCAPFTVQFNNQSSANVTGYNWTFPGGTPATSTDPNPTVVYNTKGTYDVTLEVSNSQFNDTEAMTDLVSVSEIPVAAFAENINFAVVDFTNNSVDADSYAWDFGDGNTSTMMNPTHTYAMDGNYDVMLSVTNICGTVSTTESLTIVTPPSANFGASQTAGCAPFTVQFNNNSSVNATAYSWSFPGGTPATSTDENPVVVYDTKGSFDVELTVTNAAGNDISMLSNYIQIDDVPTAAFAETTSLANVVFTNNSVDADSYVWDFGDGNTSTAQDPMHTYMNDGVYTVTLTATNGCGDHVFTDQVLIATAGPIAAFDANTTVGCAPLTVDFTNQSSGNTASVLWTFVGGDISTSVEMNPTVVYSTPGVYDVTMIAINSIGNDTIFETQYIEVLGPPAASFTNALSVTTVAFTNTSVAGDSYDWDFGDGTTSTDENPTHTFPGNGTYQVVLVTTNSCGSVTSNETIVINGAVPAADFDANNQVICIGETVNFSDESSGSPVSWDWSFDGGMPNVSMDQNPSITYNTPGVFPVTLSATNPYGTNSITQTAYVTVEDNPIAGFTSTTAGLSVDFLNGSIGGTTFSWDFGDGNSSTDENPTHVYSMNGTYIVLLTISNSCGTVTHEETVMVQTSDLSDLTTLESLEIYPNPNPGQFFVEINGTPADIIQFRILNGMGQLMKSEQVEFQTGYLKHEFDLELSAGIYLIQIQSNGETGFRKFEVH